MLSEAGVLRQLTASAITTTSATAYTLPANPSRHGNDQTAGSAGDCQRYSP